MRTRTKLGHPVTAALAALTVIVGGGAIALVSPATVAQAAGPQSCDIYASGGTPCVAAHSTTRALYGAYNGRALPGPALVGQHHPGHRRAERGRVRQRRRAGLVLRRHHLPHHRSSTTSPAGEQPPHPGAPRRRSPARLRADSTTSPTRPRRRSRSAAARRTASSSLPAPATATTTPTASPPATSPRGCTPIFDGTHYNGGCCFDYGNAETQQPGQRQRHHGGHLLRQHQGLGLRHRQRPVDHGRPGERPVLRREPALQRQRPDHQPPLRDRHRQGRAEPLGHPGRQRAVRRPVDLLQRTRAPTSPATTR